jgi:hypothetical protein
MIGALVRDLCFSADTPHPCPSPLGREGFGGEGWVAAAENWHFSQDPWTDLRTLFAL